jgi:hypothetical protein
MKTKYFGLTWKIVDGYPLILVSYLAVIPVTYDIWFYLSILLFGKRRIVE